MARRQVPRNDSLERQRIDELSVKPWKSNWLGRYATELLLHDCVRLINFAGTLQDKHLPLVSSRLPHCNRDLEVWEWGFIKIPQEFQMNPNWNLWKAVTQGQTAWKTHMRFPIKLTSLWEEPLLYPLSVRKRSYVCAAVSAHKPWPPVHSAATFPLQDVFDLSTSEFQVCGALHLF